MTISPIASMVFVVLSAVALFLVAYVDARRSRHDHASTSDGAVVPTYDVAELRGRTLTIGLNDDGVVIGCDVETGEWFVLSGGGRTHE